MDLYINPIFSNNGGINIKMRAILVDWLLSVAGEFHMTNKTFHLAISLLDLFIERKELNKNKLQRVGSACLYIASTFNEITSPSINSFVFMADNSYTENEFVECFIHVLNTLEHKVYYNTYYDTVFNKCFNTEHLNFCNYLLTSLVITRRYLLFNKEDLADLLLNFSISYKSSSLDNLVKNNYKYTYIFDQWKKTKLSSLRANKDINNLEIPDIKYEISNEVENMLLNDINNKIVHNNKIFLEYDICDKNYKKELGKGTFGNVHEYHCNGNKIAVKKFYTDWSNELSEQYLRELNTLRVLNHKNIIELLGYKHDKNNIYLVLEVMECDLDKFIKTLSNDNKRLYIKQVLEAVNYLHSMKIMHRDITTKNFLIKDNVIKLCDFGMSRQINDDGNAYTGETCSIFFRPFEFITDNSNRVYGYEIDIWSTACVIGYILNNTYLFYGDDTKNMIRDIYRKLGPPRDKNLIDKVNDKYNILPHKYEGFPDLEKNYREEMNLIYKMLNYDIVNRISMIEAVQYWDNNIK